MDKVFINNAFSKAVNNYTKSNDNVQGVMYNSFLVVVIRSLISIYSELDIINPMVIGDEELLKENLAKFGYDKTDIEVFLSNLQLFDDFEVLNENNNVKKKNPYFLINAPTTSYSSVNKSSRGIYLENIYNSSKE